MGVFSARGFGSDNMEQIGKAIAGICLTDRETGIMPPKYNCLFTEWIKGIVREVKEDMEKKEQDKNGL